MTTVANASVVFKDKNGNVGTVKGASANDVTKIRNAISDVAQVVDPTSHLPINATTSSVGVVQLADAAAVAAGTAGRIIDAAQLKDAIEHVTPAGNLMTTDTAQTVTAVKTFSSLPESSVVPTTANQLVNKQYVDDHATPVPTNMMTTDTAQTVSAVKTFSVLPQSSVAPSASSDLVNKAYVDAQEGTEVAVDSTYAEPAVKRGLLSPATDLITAPAEGRTFEDRGAQPGFITLCAKPEVPAGYLLCNGAAVSRSTYADLFAAIGTTYGAGDGSTTFNLPDMRNRYPIGSGDNVLGTYVAEQLPNVQGTVGRSESGGDAITPFHVLNMSSGALSYTTGSYLGSGAGSRGTYGKTIDLNANSSNAIYTDSGNVHPLSLSLNYIIKC